MHESASLAILVADHGLGRDEGAQARQAVLPQVARDGGRTHGQGLRDLRPGPALPAQPENRPAARRAGARGCESAGWRRRSARIALVGAPDPFAHGAFADSERHGHLPPGLTAATRRTISARLWGVVRAFLWMFIRASVSRVCLGRQPQASQWRLG